MSMGPLFFFVRLAAVLGIILVLTPCESKAQRPEDPPLVPQNPGVFDPPTPRAATPRSWLFAVDSSSRLFYIDPASGNPSMIGQTGFVRVTDIAFLPDGQLFGVTFDRLLQINPQTGAATPVGSGPGFTNVVALAADARGQLYATDTSGQFLRINQTTGTATLLGSYGGGLLGTGDLALPRTGHSLRRRAEQEKP
jgi:hypothetical protein